MLEKITWPDVKWKVPKGINTVKCVLKVTWVEDSVTQLPVILDLQDNYTVYDI